MKQKAFWAVLLTAIIGGTAGFFIKSMSIGPTSQAWLRMTIPTMVMGLWMLWSGIPFFRGNWKKMLFASSLNTVRMLLFFTAYIYTSIGNAVILFYTFPVFAALMSSTVLKEKITNRQKVLLAAAFGGIILAFSNKEFSFGDQDFIGMAAAILSAVVYSYTVILFKSEAKNHTWSELLFYQNFSGLILLLPFFEFATATQKDYSLGITYGLLIGVLAFGLFFYGLKQLKASTAAALMYMEVVSALTLSYFWQGELLSWPMLFGGAMIVGSSFLLNRS